MVIKSKIYSNSFYCILPVIGMFFSLSASAALITASFTGNECKGQGGFSNCSIRDKNGGAISPTIIKFNSDLEVSLDDDGKKEINSQFLPAITGEEWTLTPDDGVSGNSSGTWSYNPGSGDPFVRFWLTSAGNESIVSWNIDDANIALCGAGAEFSSVCMEAAIASSTGSWETVRNTNGQQSLKDLSHITFFDTKGLPDTGDDEGNVPIPAAVWLFGTGLIGMLGFSRKKSA